MSWTRCATCRKSTRKRSARYCDACRWPLRCKRTLYVWTAEKDAYLRDTYDPTIAGRVQHIASVLGWPKDTITRRAQLLGLSRPATKNGHPLWTADEIRFLERHAGTRHPHWIATKVKRSVTAVIVKMKRLRLSQLPDGYSQGDVAEAFGVSRDTVERWQRLGFLRASFQPSPGQPYRITDADLLAFVRDHRTAFDLRKADQTWFLDLVLGGDVAATVAA